MLKRSAVRQRHGDALVVWVNPATIDWYVGQNLAVFGRSDVFLGGSPSWARQMRLGRALVRRLRPKDTPFFIAPAAYRPPEALEHLDKFRLVTDLVHHGDAYTESEWFRRLVRALDANGEAVHKTIVMRSCDEVHAFFRGYVLPLVVSMRERGYDAGLGSNLGNAMVGADGRLHKANGGEHRFFVARTVGTTRFPLRVVGAHATWERREGLRDHWDDVPRIIEAVQKAGSLHR